MIQDIGAGRFHNEYHDFKPQAHDTMIGMKENKILVRIKGGEMFFPEYQETQEENGIYLFSIDEKRYFYAAHPEEFGEYRYQKISVYREYGPRERGFAAVTAYHLADWYAKNRFCGRCGVKMIHDHRERMMYCPECHNMVYPRISPAVIVGVIHGDRILLTKYAGREYTKYSLIAGFTEIGETLEETVQREVMEEVGLKVKNIRYYKNQPWGMSGSLLTGFFADLDGDDTIRLDETELSTAEWFRYDEMPAKDDGVSLTREMIRVFTEQRNI